MNPILLQLAIFAGSLLAILLVAALVRWLKLGEAPRIADAAMARQLAYDLYDGFDATDIAVDKGGGAAVLRDAAGHYLLLRPHGAHFIARPILSPDTCRLDRQNLTIGTGDRLEPPVTLQLGQAAQIWASRFRHLGEERDARAT